MLEKIIKEIADKGAVSSIFRGFEGGGGSTKRTLKLGTWKRGGGLCLKKLSTKLQAKAKWWNAFTSARTRWLKGPT